MSNYILSPQMSLLVPIVGVAPGPEWAQDINNSLTIIDSHDHSNGSGVQITPSGLNISSDLTMQGNNLVSTGSVSFLDQAATISGTTAIYSVLGDLYYNDLAGNRIRLTINGSVAGANGTISGLVSPASASFQALSETFIWQGNAFKPATMDMGSIIVRKLSNNSDGILLQAPTSLANTASIAYNLTLPTLPSVQSFMTLDAAGQMAAPWTVDNDTIKIVSNQLKVNTASTSLIFGEHCWELNGNYAELGFPQLDIDARFLVPYNITIQSIWIYNGVAGVSNITQHKLTANAIGGVDITISDTGQFLGGCAQYTWTDSGSVIGAQYQVVKPNIAVANIDAGYSIQWSLLSAISGGTDARIRIFYTRR